MKALQNKVPILGADLSATVVTPWIDVRDCQTMSFQIVTPSTGSPAGAWSFEATNDVKTVLSERDNNVRAPNTASAAPATALTVSTVHGSSLTVAGAANSFVAFSDGLPCFIRAKFTPSSGGTGTVPNIFISGRD